MLSRWSVKVPNMESQIGWLIAGIAIAVGSCLGILSGVLFIHSTQAKKRICELMRDKGALSMQVSILEGVLKEKERQ